MVALAPEPLPIVRDDTGTLRIEGTRITLDDVVQAFDCGASAEEVVEQFPTLELSSVYATFAYIIRNRVDVDAYLTQRGVDARNVRERVEKLAGPGGLRARLLARR